MRVLLLIVASLLAGPALAQGWGSYDNSRFGYTTEIPPGFSGYGENANGDGQVFDNQAKAQVLSFWGRVLASDFAGEVAAEIGYAARDGWNISYQAITPRWASFSSVMGQRIFYTHMIALCDGQSYAAMTAQYSAIHAADMRPVIERLVDNFRATGC